MIKVGKAEFSDIDNIKAFLSAQGLGEKDIGKKDFFVYYDCHKLLGCGISYALAGYCIIEFIIVDDKFRRNKIGTAIAKTILNYYERSGSKYALGFGDCREFYLSMGFNAVSIDEFPVYIENSMDTESSKSIYGVSLAGYFKECCKI